jgi:hypothetical protein
MQSASQQRLEPHAGCGGGCDAIHQDVTTEEEKKKARDARVQGEKLFER